MAAFVQEGNNYVRILGAVRPVLRDKADFVVAAAPPGSAALGEEVRAYCVANFAKYRARGNRSGGDGLPSARQAAIDRYAAKWDRFLRFWTGTMVEGDTIVVYCSERVDRERWIRDMAQTFAELFLSLVLTKPEHGKWEKLTLCLDWAVPMQCVNGMLNLLVQRAGRPLTIEIEGARSETINIHEKKNLPRWASAKAITGDVETMASWATMAVALEHIRAQTSFLFPEGVTGSRGRVQQTDLGLHPSQPHTDAGLATIPAAPWARASPSPEARVRALRLRLLSCALQGRSSRPSRIPGRCYGKGSFGGKSPKGGHAPEGTPARGRGRD
jgi:hypothetical protein